MIEPTIGLTTLIKKALQFIIQTATAATRLKRSLQVLSRKAEDSVKHINRVQQTLQENHNIIGEPQFRRELLCFNRNVKITKDFVADVAGQKAWRSRMWNHDRIDRQIAEYVNLLEQGRQNLDSLIVAHTLAYPRKKYQGNRDQWSSDLSFALQEDLKESTTSWEKDQGKEQAEQSLTPHSVDIVQSPRKQAESDNFSEVTNTTSAASTKVTFMEHADALHTDGHTENVQHLGMLLCLMKEWDTAQDAHFHSGIEKVATLVKKVNDPTQITPGIKILSEYFKSSAHHACDILDKALDAALTHMARYPDMALDCLRIMRRATDGRVAQCLPLIVEKGGIQKVVALLEHDGADGKVIELGIFLMAVFARDRYKVAGVDSDSFQRALEPIGQTLTKLPRSWEIQRSGCAFLFHMFQGDTQLRDDAVAKQLQLCASRAIINFPECGIIHRFGVGIIHEFHVVRRLDLKQMSADVLMAMVASFASCKLRELHSTPTKHLTFLLDLTELVLPLPTKRTQRVLHSALGSVIKKYELPALQRQRIEQLVDRLHKW